MANSASRLNKVRLHRVGVADGRDPVLTRLFLDAIPATSPSNRLQPTSSSLVSGLRLAQQSLQECFTEPTHNCQPRPNFAIDWPQRLLRISAVVTLVDFDDSTTGRFAALSYCWGDSQELVRNPPLIATASTCASLRTGIPFSGLPLTVRQAVEVCVCLGIEYLWVDALCIIQDDTADWEREAKKMATVYTMATVTIIAASSTSCHSGFFHVDLGTVGLDSPLPPQHQLVARRVNRSGFHRFPEDSGTHPARGDPIDDRGWTYQEQFLATRYIKFTDNDIQWRCRAGTACLCHQVACTETKAGTLNLRPRAVNRWYRVVQNFNQRTFTVATDKLPAFSGVVKKLAPEMAAGADNSTIYIAGLWRHLMLPGEDLLWYRYAGAPAHCYQDYVAPSFSWASVGTRIVFSNVDINMGSWLSELVNADRKLAPNSDEFGKVLEAFLTLRGPLISCTIRKLPNQNPEPELSPGQKLTLQSYRLDCAVSQVTLQTGKVTVQRPASSRSSFSDTDAHILLLQTQESRLLNCHMLRGLLFGQLATSGEFQRLGLVRLQGSAEDVMKLKLEQQKQLVTIV